MRVLVACEFSGRVRDAFIALGHDAMSCDLLATEVPGPHYQGDVFDVVGEGWDLLIAHPPCTDLAVSGARWFAVKGVERQEVALEFVRRLLSAPVARIAVENPIGVISSRVRRPDQVIQPWWFGDPEVKSTCLWLKGLPMLVPDQVVAPRWSVYRSRDERVSAWWQETGYLPRSVRGHVRSITFLGVARAMAAQWSEADRYAFV